MSDLVASNLLLPELCTNPGRIRIFHPGYKDDDEPLLTLIGCDTVDGGLLREVAETACAIISMNRFDGHLTDGKGIITDKILLPGTYYWHLSDDHYAIVPVFRWWSFPKDPPEVWRTKDRRKPELNRCFLTEQSVGKENAHIIPKTETEWFEDNRMWRYYESSNVTVDIDFIDNLMALRADIHVALDQKMIGFFPKNGKVVLHSMVPETSRLHNAPVHADVCKELLLARFAWTLFPNCLAPWLLSKRRRKLWMSVGDEIIEQDVSVQRCRQIAHASRPKSTSRTKRKLDDIDGPSDSSRSHDADLDSGLGTDEDVKPTNRWEDNHRGRKRLRGDYSTREASSHTCESCGQLTRT